MINCVSITLKITRNYPHYQITYIFLMLSWGGCLCRSLTPKFNGNFLFPSPSPIVMATVPLQKPNVMNIHVSLRWSGSFVRRCETRLDENYVSSQWKLVHLWNLWRKRIYFGNDRLESCLLNDVDESDSRSPLLWMGSFTELADWSVLAGLGLPVQFGIREWSN